jgi:5-methylcytosine-specific restriction protein A
MSKWKPRAGYHRETAEQKKDKEAVAFYHSPEWIRVRKAALQRDGYLCQLRLSQKCTTLATEVHHIKPRKDYPELALDLANLISCCWYCHEETKPRERKRKREVSGVRVIAIRDGSEK